VRVGGPHCMRECPVTGDIWVGLKGSVACHPGETIATGDAKGFRRLKAAMNRACCSAGTVKEYMDKLQSKGYDTPPPEGWALWRLTPSKYDPNAADGAKGGVLFEGEKSPPMLCTDAKGNCWVAQDGAESVMFVDALSNVSEQIKLPHPACSQIKIAGPAIATAPDGAIWLSLLGGHCALIRIDPETKHRRLYEFGGPSWAGNLRLIHLAFSARKEEDRYNRIYALSSDLIDDEAPNALLMLRMDDAWQTCLGRRVMPLPTQDCACHRIAFVQPDADPETRSVLISEMASSKLLQIMVRNLTRLTHLESQTTLDKDGFEVRVHTDVAEEEGDRV